MMLLLLSVLEGLLCNGFGLTNCAICVIREPNRAADRDALAHVMNLNSVAFVTRQT